MKQLLLVFLCISTALFSQVQSDFLFKCDFNTGDPEWKSYKQTNVVVETKSGKLHIEHLKEGTSWYQYKEVFLNTAEDFEITMASRQYRGQTNEGHGLVFAAEDLDDCYVFDVSSTGYFSVFKNVGGKYTSILDWTESGAVKKMLETNVQTVKNIAGKWHFYVNGTEVYTMTAQKAFGFYYGFYVSGLNYVEHDYLYIKRKAKPINLIDNYTAFGEKEHLSANINSAYTEISPVISADEKMLFVTRDEHPGNTGAKLSDDIWVSKLNEKDSTWGPLKNVGSPLNTEGRNFLISISNDNNTVLVGNKYDKNGEVVGKGISISHRTAKGWSIPKSMEIKNYYNNNEYTESCLSPEGNVLLITCERDDTYGDKDIYVCFLQADSTWSEPKNIGKTVNSFAGEVGPFLAADGKTMYFSSAGHPGYGSNDIFMTRRLDDTWKNWSTPKNLGPKINTEKWDAYYTVPASGKHAYVASTTPGALEDIYKIKQPESAKPLPLILIHGVVYNSETKQPMQAEITYSELGSSKIIGNATSNPSTGVFMIALPKGKKYSFHATHKGFASTHYNTDATNLKSYKEENVDLYLTPIKEGATIVMNNLFFTANKYDLLPESFPELDKLYEMMKENPKLKIEIGGHTSINNSGDKFNMDLSTNRALAVKNYIITKGIKEDRITHKGYGFSKPIYKEESEVIQAKNRRVEFTILAK
jgi:outer membrane protein OmpA-like peptidoglycan-associated protein